MDSRRKRLSREQFSIRHTRTAFASVILEDSLSVILVARLQVLISSCVIMPVKLRIFSKLGTKSFWVIRLTKSSCIQRVKSSCSFNQETIACGLFSTKMLRVLELRKDFLEQSVKIWWFDVLFLLMACTSYLALKMVSHISGIQLKSDSKQSRAINASCLI